MKKSLVVFLSLMLTLPSVFLVATDDMPSTGNLPVLVEKAPIIAMIITNHQFTNEAEVTYEELQSVLGGDNGNLKAVTYQAVSKDITDTGYRLYVYNNTSGTLKLSVNTSQSTPLQSVLSGTNYYMTLYLRIGYLPTDNEGNYKEYNTTLNNNLPYMYVKSTTANNDGTIKIDSDKRKLSCEVTSANNSKGEVVCTCLPIYVDLQDATAAVTALDYSAIIVFDLAAL